MYNNYSTYSDAVNHAANLVLTDRGIHHTQRMERLVDLLHSLAYTIPESWGTRSRSLLAGCEGSIDRLIHVLSIDIAEHPELSEYFVLSSILLLALTIKQLGTVEPVSPAFSACA